MPCDGKCEGMFPYLMTKITLCLKCEYAMNMCGKSVRKYVILKWIFCPCDLMRPLDIVGMP